jgi:hypothetical protein
MDPGIAGLNAFLTYMYGCRLDFDLIEVRALGRHRFYSLPGMLIIRTSLVTSVM